jgi:hypothetical protein
MKNIKNFETFNESNSHVGTLIGDSIKSIINEWSDKPFKDYTLETGKVFINTQEGGDLLNKYNLLKKYLKDNFNVDSEIKDVGFKSKSTALVFNSEQFVD